MIYNDFLGGVRQHVIENAEKLIRRRVYFGTQSLDAGDGDVHQVFYVNPNDIVLDVWADVITAAPTNATIDIGYGGITNFWGNGLAIDAVGVARKIVSGTTTWNPPVIEDKSEVTIEIEIDGASLGDQVMVSGNIDMADMGLSGYVISPNYVAVQLANNTGGILDILQDIDISVFVNKAPLAPVQKTFTANDTIDIKATTDTEDVNISSGVLDLYMRVLRYKSFTG